MGTDGQLSLSLAYVSPPRIDEEALTQGIDAEARRLRGAWYTPAWLVELVLARAAERASALTSTLGSSHARGTRPGRLAVIDPACGGGAFLVGARRRFPGASLFGLELDPDASRLARGRVPGARIAPGDALRGGLDALLEHLPRGALELWVGNPPYNGRSSLLDAGEDYRALCERLTATHRMPPGTSLRDDYAFFLLLAAERLARRPGVLAFVTSATLLDAFMYAPLRALLLERLQLVEVLELPEGTFQGTRVRTCVTVWTSAGALHRSARRGAGSEPLYTRLLSAPRGSTAPNGEARTDAMQEEPPASAPPREETPPEPFVPSAPAFVLRPPDGSAEALDARWRADGATLDALIPVHLPGLKTRFEALLTDRSPERLLARIDALFEAARGEPSSREELLRGFARAQGLPEREDAKLRALGAVLAEKLARTPPEGADPSRIRPYLRWAGPKHREGIPDGARAFCYLDRRLIPRGDHRLQGTWDPHTEAVKLVFNAHELPLTATLVDAPGCVHAWRHARFAPLNVPERILERGPAGGRDGAPLGPSVPNLTPLGSRWAERLGGPRALFAYVARFMTSTPVQEVWAPAFATTRSLPIPAPTVDAANP